MRTIARLVSHSYRYYFPYSIQKVAEPTKPVYVHKDLAAKMVKYWNNLSFNKGKGKYIYVNMRW